MEYLLYLAPLVLYAAWSFARARRRDRADAGAGGASGGRPTKRPRIDPAKCIGCGDCLLACPEQTRRIVLGLVAGKAELVNPDACRGHGACRQSCPTQAITLEFP